MRLDTGEEIGGVEVGENVLNGWKFVGEDLVGVAERHEKGARKHVADREGKSSLQCWHDRGNRLVRRRACVRRFIYLKLTR